MNEDEGAHFWLRFRKSTGLLGGVAVVLVVFASRSGGGFDWMVFGLSSLALLLAWSQSWMLVPTHLRHKAAENREWQRYIDSDWRLVDAVSGLSGAEIDELRAIFREGNDKAARVFMAEQWPAFSESDTQDFLRFFCNVFMDTLSSYVDEDGRLTPYD